MTSWCCCCSTVWNKLFSWLGHIWNLPNTPVTDGSILEHSQDASFSSSSSGPEHQHLDQQENDVGGRDSPTCYLLSYLTRSYTEMSEEEQVQIAERVGLIVNLPQGVWDGCKDYRECVICMCEFVSGDCVRYLPCVHTYHARCIDHWLMRSFTCPSCMEPVHHAYNT